MPDDQDKPKNKPGPAEERLTVDMDFDEAAKRLVQPSPSSDDEPKDEESESNERSTDD